MIDRLLPPEVRQARLIRALAVMSVLLVVAAIWSSVTTTDPYGQRASASERAAVMKQATAWAEQVMSFNAATAEADTASAKDLMTDRMRAAYDRTLPPAEDWKRQAKSAVKVSAEVARLDGRQSKKTCPPSACAVGLQRLTGDEATVLLFVNQFATAKTTKNVVVNPTWETMHLIRRDGRWAIDAMESP